PATKTIVVKGIRDGAARMAGLQTGELDIAFGMTGKLLSRLMSDRNLRWDPNFTGPWWLMFPGYNEQGSPFRDKRVRQAVSLAIKRSFAGRKKPQDKSRRGGTGTGGKTGAALRGTGARVPKYNVERARQLRKRAVFPVGFDVKSFPSPPYFDMGERILT